MKDRDREGDMRKLAGAFFKYLDHDQDNEYGAIGVDSKRPFGNSDVEGDILRIIGVDVDSENEQEDEEYREYAASLYNGLVDWLREFWKRANE